MQPFLTYDQWVSAKTDAGEFVPSWAIKAKAFVNAPVVFVPGAKKTRLSTVRLLTDKELRDGPMYLGIVALHSVLPGVNGDPHRIRIMLL